MTLEKSIKPNGYAVRSWGDIVAVASLLAMFLGCVAWGLKLEAKLDTLQLIHTSDVNSLVAENNALKIIIAKGILPRAEERINRIDDFDAELTKRVEKLEGKH